MADSPYTEGWPKRHSFTRAHTWVVPLSDAERLREALKLIKKTVDADRHADRGAIWCADVADAALNPKRD